jgi:hypothetical protein
MNQTQIATQVPYQMQRPMQGVQGQMPMQGVQGQMPMQGVQGQIPIQGMQGQVQYQMPTQMQGMQGQVQYQMPTQMQVNQMYPINNQGMVNSGGYMANMYQPMNPGFISYSNPGVQPTVTNAPTPTNVNSQGTANNGEAPPSLLQRNTDLIGDPNAPTGNGIINVFFEASTGSRAVLNLPEDTPVKDTLKKYAEKIKINQAFIGKKIMFLYTGKRIDNEPNCDKTLKELKILNGSQITVFDQANVLGA